ncbi:hypothetical protein [Clostridium oryzae]|uniref:Uncharacterized protein n=1 Tax=Clostridium oryzae TaxID=1450648 RepID=A0A1V4IRG7_9CLOT|nr:hypothetical protein [Clostridium oryzae]OPJ62526.1 hypothetical protein CLORY_16560 [Clostridium oryzae]
MKLVKSKIAIIFLVLFMIAVVPLTVKADEKMYGVLINRNSEYFLITDTKEYKLDYKGTEDISTLVGEVVSFPSSGQTNDSVETDSLVKEESSKISVSSSYTNVKIISIDDKYYYQHDSKNIEVTSKVDLNDYVNKYCDFIVEQTKYQFDNGTRTIVIPEQQIINIKEGSPYDYSYKSVTLKGRVKITANNSYVQVGDKQYKVFFNSSSIAKKYKTYNKRYVTITGKQKYKKDLRNNSTTKLNEVYSSKYKLTYKIHYKSVKATGFVSNNLKIGKYTLAKSASKYKSFIIKLKGKVAVTDNGVKITTSKVVKPTSVTKISTTNLKVFSHLSSLRARNKTFARAKALHYGSAHNSCVYFSSQALREVGVRIPTSTCVTNKFASKLRRMGWKKVTNYKKLTPGSICFTKDPWGGNGKPTHAYIFMGWVKKGNYTEAYVCDNQAGDYKGKVLHIRNISKKSKHKGQYKDAFGFAMVSPKTYGYLY